VLPQVGVALFVEKMVETCPRLFGHVWKEPIQATIKQTIFMFFIIIFLQHLIEKRREKRAAELVKKDNEVTVKLENAAIERSKSVESAVLGKYSIWRKEIENENVDSTVRLMRDQIIMAKVYLSIAKMKNKVELYQELIFRLKESQRALGDTVSDSDLHHRFEALGNFIEVHLLGL